MLFCNYSWQAGLQENRLSCRSSLERLVTVCQHRKNSQHFYYQWSLSLSLYRSLAWVKWSDENLWRTCTTTTWPPWLSVSSTVVPTSIVAIPEYRFCGATRTQEPAERSRSLRRVNETTSRRLCPGSFLWDMEPTNLQVMWKRCSASALAFHLSSKA